MKREKKARPQQQTLKLDPHLVNSKYECTSVYQVFITGSLK